MAFGKFVTWLWKTLHRSQIFGTCKLYRMKEQNTRDRKAAKLLNSILSNWGLSNRTRWSLDFPHNKFQKRQTGFVNSPKQYLYAGLSL